MNLSPLPHPEMTVVSLWAACHPYLSVCPGTLAAGGGDRNNRSAGRPYHRLGRVLHAGTRYSGLTPKVLFLGCPI